MVEAGLIAGGAIYTYADTLRPRRIVPEDPAVIEAMKGTGVRLALAWLG